MIKVKVITQGKVREKWLHLALDEYEKRLQGKMEFEWILLDSEKDLQEKALKEPHLIALDSRGKCFSSSDLSKTLFTKWGSRLCFVIGGANGLSETVLKHASLTFSLSKLTFTHQMVRLILIEQLYRALEIERGSSYHK